MRIKIWASTHADAPESGPYKMIDIVEREDVYAVADSTHYGPVIKIPPPLPPFLEGVDQSVIVKLNPESLNVTPDESIFPKPPVSYDKIQFFPIHIDRGTFTDEPLPPGTHVILEKERLAIEDVSGLLTPNTFAVWSKECFVSRDTAESLRSMKYAIAHRYSSSTERDSELDRFSTNLIDMSVACLSLIRPTRRSRTGIVTGTIANEGKLNAQSFNLHEPVEVPEVQKLFAVRPRDVDLLRAILPEFIQLYRTDESGKLGDEYEPLRMAIQLYGQAYTIDAWKPRHILWWSAIEALFGSSQVAATARIFGLFGNKNLVGGYHCLIYEKGDIPSYNHPTSESLHKLGEMVPLIYDVRNQSAHGQRVADKYLAPLAHPYGGTVSGVNVFSEALTFIIRKTIVTILASGHREKFKNRETREKFWLYEYGLNKKQSKKRLHELQDSLGVLRTIDAQTPDAE